MKGRLAGACRLASPRISCLPRVREGRAGCATATSCAPSVVATQASAGGLYTVEGARLSRSPLPKARKGNDFAAVLRSEVVVQTLLYLTQHTS